MRTGWTLEIVEEASPVLDAFLASMKPDTLLDVGCGCGQFTESLGHHCTRIVAIDAVPELISKWRNVRAGSSLRFSCMDGRTLAFTDDTFSAVLERDTLHHISGWTQVIDEMVRVSSKYVLIEEPVDDLRSVEKRNTFEAQNLLLELQQEVGYPHYQHLAADDLISHVQSRASLVETHIEDRDGQVSVEEFFSSFAWFATQTARESYWHDRLEAFRSALGTGGLCEDDKLLLVATKGACPRAIAPRRIAR